MNKQKKELALAGLMGWETQGSYISTDDLLDTLILDPYSTRFPMCCDGLAQFAAILLKFPEVMKSRSFPDDADYFGHVTMISTWDDIEPTQENILDEILKMNGKWVEDDE